MLSKPACKLVTLVKSDISPIDKASYLYLLSNVITCSRKCDIQQERIKKKIKSFQQWIFRLAIRIKGIQF